MSDYFDNPVVLDRQKVTEVFNDYVKDYDISNPKIALKVIHTGKVAMLCEEIALSLGMDEAHVNMAWLIGMLHDIGRFEQLRRYNTFSDAVSIDHALLGCSILFEEGRIRDFIKDDSFDGLIHAAIANHSAYRISEELNETEKVYAHILRDADKIDIFRVQIDTPLEEIYDVTTYELKNSVVSEKVMESFFEEHATLRSLKQTAIDYVVGHISLAFELVYDKSREITVKQGYLDKLMNFESENEETKKQLEQVRNYMNGWLLKAR